MKNCIHYIIVVGSFLLLPVLMRGQVLVKASVDRDKILIGEPIKLTLEVHSPLGKAVDWFRIDSIPHFEIIDKGKADTTDGIDGKQMQQVLTITSFDSGQVVLPALLVKVADKQYATDSIAIDVSYTPADLSKDYRDIKEIEEVAAPWYIAYIPWILGALTLIALGVIVYLLRKPKKPAAAPPAPVVPALSAYEEALQGLDACKAAFAGNGEVKTYYSRLNDILRVFIFRKLAIATLEKTNDELVSQLRRVPMDKDSFNQLVAALQITDFVKFARYEPDANDNEKNFAVIQSAIKTLNNIS